MLEQLRPTESAINAARAALQASDTAALGRALATAADALAEASICLTTCVKRSVAYTDLEARNNLLSGQVNTLSARVLYLETKYDAPTAERREAEKQLAECLREVERLRKFLGSDPGDDKDKKNG